ncbi:expressed unknown protein [Seminavis robusta]|uniref:DUF6824 domain-containing protein n=1 Tax=Seminavis robusta TaxID=568900 RepID=A0A9N8HLA5_9STRA|nr:expressed unknown protein [Seminavis robusta]|eukprot:Sro807_g205310.1 n/a (531) ;mRNA; r:37015-38607
MSSETANNGRKSESGMTGITDPRDTDVLCGRGGAALRHPGNQTYRRLVNLNKGLYITCLKTEKLKISRSIVAAIREQNGRFLEKDAGKASWFDIGDKKAIEKTSQALREGQPKLRQKIVEMGGGAAGTAALMEQQFGANGIYAQSAVQQQLQQQQMRATGAFDPTNFAQQLGAGGQMGAAAMAMMNPPHHSMATALRQQQHHQQHQQFRQQHQMQQQQQQHMNQHQHHHHPGAARMHHDMPPPQARQALHSEMMRLSMHGDDEAQPQQTGSSQQPPQTSSSSSNNNSNGADHMPLRPSLVKRGSAAANELGMGPSSTSLMSEFSMFGNSAHNGSTYSAIGSINSSSRGGGGPGGDPYNPNPYQQSGMDRRNMFAKMKYSRPSSDRMSSGRAMGGASAHSIGDGMPDFHMVESQLSLYSNLSGMTGTDSKTKSLGDTSGDKKPAGSDMLGGAGSRHSIMSGLSRISDTSEVHSIFSDLSRKIGNVSTRSIAMSEISGIDAYRGGEDSDSTPSFGEADARVAPSGTMDFDVF